MDKINIYVHSKNRNLSKTISNFTVRIPQNLLRLSQGEHFTLIVNGFYCYNSFLMGFIVIIVGLIVLITLIMNFI